MSVYHDTSLKKTVGGKKIYHDRWIAEICVNGKRIRFRNKSKELCEKWFAFRKKLQKYVTPSIRVLTSIPEFPGYCIDMADFSVYSLVPHRFHKMKSRNNGVIHLTVNNKSHTVTIPRILYSIRHGISYYDIPKDKFILRISEDSHVKVDDRSSFMLEVNEKRRNKIHEDRIVTLKNDIETLQLLLLAYQGNCLPLLLYVESRKDWYIDRISPCKEHSQLGYNMAYDCLLSHMSFSTYNIHNFDWWFIKKARGCLVSKRIKESRHIQIEEVRRL